MKTKAEAAAPRRFTRKTGPTIRKSRMTDQRMNWTISKELPSGQVPLGNPVEGEEDEIGSFLHIGLGHGGEGVEVVVVAVVVLLPGIWLLAQYNTLVALRNHIREAWSNIDTELKRRYELIPNLVETVKGYAVHERVSLLRIGRGFKPRETAAYGRT